MDKLIILKDVSDLGLKEGDELTYNNRTKLYHLKHHDEDISENRHFIFERTVKINNHVVDELIESGEGVYESSMKKVEEVHESGEPCEVCECYPEELGCDKEPEPETIESAALMTEPISLHTLENKINYLSEAVGSDVSNLNKRVSELEKFYDRVKFWL